MAPQQAKDETTIYIVYAQGPGGQVTDSVTVNVIPVVTIQITSPVSMQTITGTYIVVEGTISNALGNDTGVTVNGHAAMVYNDRFITNPVPLQEGENTITAVATDTAGNTAEVSITVDAATTGNYITITADPESGVSPFETTLSIDGSFSFTDSSVTYTGPGTEEFIESNSHEYRVEIIGEGIYYFTAEVTNDQNNTYTDTISIVVLNQATLDASLRAKWNAMRNALTLNDIDGAVKFFDSSTKDAFRNAFSALSQTQIVDIADELPA